MNHCTPISGLQLAPVVVYGRVACATSTHHASPPQPIDHVPTSSCIRDTNPVGDANRGCARAWRNELAPLWRALGSAEGVFDAFEGSGVLVYGCPLRLLFKPGPKLTRARKARRQQEEPPSIASGAGPRIICHLRFGDAHFLDKRGIAEQNKKMVDRGEAEGDMRKSLVSPNTVLGPGHHGTHTAHPPQVRERESKRLVI